MTATIRFDPSGRVGRVDVEPATSPAADCVRRKLREIAVAPFDGQPVTMRLSSRL